MLVWSIFKGFDQGKNKRQLYGPGIYSAPDPKVAEHYAVDFSYKEDKYLVLIQNRVNMAKTKTVKDVPILMTGKRGDYYVTSDEDSIRPYGILIKRA